MKYVRLSKGMEKRKKKKRWKSGVQRCGHGSSCTLGQRARVACDMYACLTPYDGCRAWVCRADARLQAVKASPFFFFYTCQCKCLPHPLQIEMHTICYLRAETAGEGGASNAWHVPLAWIPSSSVAACPRSTSW